MDDLVKAAMAKWPNVPDCYGWLGLDSRGTWYMRDDRTQAMGPFSVPPGDPLVVAKGSALRHEKLIEFIHRNYLSDDQGRWFFQNGPQRVYVELEAAPWIWRVLPDGSVQAHTGAAVTEVKKSLIDEHGHLFLLTDLGFGLVHTADMLQAAGKVETGEWQPEEVRWEDTASLGGFVRSPAVRSVNG